MHSIHKNGPKINMLDCCIHSKLNGCDQYFSFDFAMRFLHTIFGSCFAHALRWSNDEYSTWNRITVKKRGKQLSTFFPSQLEFKKVSTNSTRVNIPCFTLIFHISLNGNLEWNITNCRLWTFYLFIHTIKRTLTFDIFLSIP